MIAASTAGFAIGFTAGRFGTLRPCGLGGPATCNNKAGCAAGKLGWLCTLTGAMTMFSSFKNGLDGFALRHPSMHGFDATTCKRIVPVRVPENVPRGCSEVHYGSEGACKTPTSIEGWWSRGTQGTHASRALSSCMVHAIWPALT